MDFLKILRSFEEFIFEAMTWLLFYPMTLWRIVTRPISTMAYSDGEQLEVDEGRYDDAISPPLLLLITLVLTNLFGMALHVPPAAGPSTLLKAIESSPQNLVLFRSMAFSLLPLVAAVTLLIAEKARPSRQNLRPPFYAQCYLVAPLAMALSSGGMVYQRRDIDNAWGLGLMAAAAIWFTVAETRWFAGKLSIAAAKAFGLTTVVVLVALVFFVVMALALVSL